MSVIGELMNQIRKEEQMANKERYVGNAKEIRIHPKWFYELMDDPKSNEYVIVSEQYVNLCGYPIVRSADVEKWEIIF